MSCFLGQINGDGDGDGVCVVTFSSLLFAIASVSLTDGVVFS